MNEETAAALARRRRVVETATGIFLRYGYARTTMADIAQAAGLSRPTLYLTFPDKEGVFQAVIETMVAAKLATIRNGLSGQPSLDAKLRFACEFMGSGGLRTGAGEP